MSAHAPLSFFDSRIADPAKLDPEYAKARGWDLVERDWTEFGPLCSDAERKFLTTAREHFYGARWQMHCTLVCSTLPGFEKGASAGPDFFVQSGGRRCGVECTSLRITDDYPEHLPTPGRRRYGQVFFVGKAYDDHRLARLGDAVREKRKKREKHVRKGLLGPDDPFVIAVCLGELFPSMEPLPDAVRVCYGAGPLMIVQPIAPKGEKPIASYLERPAQLSVKRNSNDLAKSNTLFRDTENDGVSGLIFSRDCHNAFGGPRDGREMIFVHNVRATNPVEIGTFRFGIEWGAAEGRGAEVNDWRKRDGLLGSPR